MFKIYKTSIISQVWNLVADKNVRYTVVASLRLLAVFLASYLCAKNVNLRATVLFLGLVHGFLFYFLGLRIFL